MLTYTVSVQWLERRRGGWDYTLGRRTHRGIRATSTADACRQALAHHTHRINPSVSSAWYDWPQPR